MMIWPDRSRRQQSHPGFADPDPPSVGARRRSAFGSSGDARSDRALPLAGTARLDEREADRQPPHQLAPRMGKAWAAQIAQALSEQTVVVLGTQAATIVLPRLAQQLAALRRQRRQREDVAREVEQLVLAHPLHPVLTSMPGVGVRTAARLLIDVVTRTFASAAHLAAYAGLAPVTRRSDSSIRGEHTLPTRKQTAEARAVPVGVRSAARSHLEGLLRSQDQPRETPQSGPHRASSPTLRCLVRHAPRWNAVQPAAGRKLVDNDIGAPPSSAAFAV